MNDPIVQQRIDNDEDFDINVLEFAFQKNCGREIKLFGKPRGTHYDGDFYTTDEKGIMRLSYLLEIKCRKKYTEHSFSQGFIQVEKIDWIREITEEQKLPAKVIIIYPKSDCYYSYDVEEVKSYPKMFIKVPKCSEDENTEYVLSEVYLLPLGKERRYELHYGEFKEKNKVFQKKFEINFVK